MSSMLSLRVHVNGETRSLEPETTVRALLESMGAKGDGVAVAVNDEIVLRSAWPDTLLHDDDRIEVLSAAPGG
jgi:sulfur carrier protein